MLWHCWLGGRKGVRPIKNWVVGCWRGYLSGAMCRCIWPSWCHCHSLYLASVNPDWFTFLVPAHPGSPGQNAVKRVCVCASFWKNVHLKPCQFVQGCKIQSYTPSWRQNGHWHFSGLQPVGINERVISRQCFNISWLQVTFCQQISCNESTLISDAL